MSVENYYFGKLREVLIEIRDEMRSLREEMQAFLAQPQPIILNGSDLVEPGKEELEKQLDDYFEDQSVDRNIITKRDAANIASKQEREFLERWMQIIRGDLYNSQIRLGDALKLTKNAADAAYWRGCVDTAQHILMLMEVTLERGKDV